MECKLNRNVSYALALEGGGAKGAYQIGAWRALKENDIHISAIAGTSVGAINGALMLMGDLNKAEALWESISYSKIMDVDDVAMQNLLRGKLRGLELKAAVSQLRDILKNRGFDVTPLYRWLKDTVDETAIRSSETELYIVTCSVKDWKELELRAKELDDGCIADMLLASAYLPVFRNEKLGGKRYADGGLRDVLPLHALLENGYQNILAIRLFGFGVERPVRIPRSVNLFTVAPTLDLGGTLMFDAQQSQINMKIGYFDTLRLLYGLSGTRWYVNACWTEREAYHFLLRRICPCLQAAGHDLSLREINESIFPAMAKLLSVPDTDYRGLLIACLEDAAERAQLDRWKIYTEDQLLAALSSSSALSINPELPLSAFARRNHHKHKYKAVMRDRA